jgi:acyl-coenzyme A synthetase/AMP-(fatty) acid ligase
MASFGRPPSGTGIIGTVAPQHMFGFETTVMLPLQSGAAVLEARPAYPADLAEALTVATRRNIGTLWLMTTPLQLRAFYRELPALRGLHRIITATMPLARDLAQDVERDWGVRLEEIFGCTEGGILATRRPAETLVWTPAAGLEFSADADGSARVQGGHLPRSLSLSDRIRMVESPADGTSGAFELVGRDEDVVKIAGKRASLSGLADQALAIAGVRDAVFFVPGPGSVRLAAILVAPERSLADLRAELARRIDAAFLPRPLVLAESIARDPNGKLPRAALEKMLGAATTSRAQAPAPEDAVLERAWCIPADHPALPGHFPGRPIVPGVMLLDAVEAMLADHGYRLRECMQVKFIAPVAPVSPLTLRLEISGGQRVRFLIRSAGQTAVTGILRCSRVEANA